ncbi:MAG: hypothetical protein AAF564_10485 [Bacteroidota bacterium]
MLQEIESLLAKAQHWHIFVLLTGLFLLPRYTWVGSGHPVVAAGMSALFFVAFLMWLWVILKTSHKMLPPENTPPLPQLMKLFLFVGGWGVVSTLMISATDSVTGLMRLLNIASFSCIVYLLVIVAKSYVRTQSDSSITFMDYAGIAVLLWIFPLGVWLIQPAVNKMYSATGSDSGIQDV